MKIDQKCLDLGITPELVLYLISKTKHKGRGTPISAYYCHQGYRDYTHCIYVEMDSDFRKQLTLHISPEKLRILNRNLKIQSLLE